MTILTKAFWKYAAERAIKTFVQTLLAALVTGGVAVGVDQMPWLGALSLAFGATVISLLTSITAYTGVAPDIAAVLKNPIAGVAEVEARYESEHVPQHAAADAAETQIFPQLDDSPHAPTNA